MKFFNNLPKTTFSTTLGNFNISDFFTYLDVDKTQVDETTVAVDDKTTLVEAAHNVYKDVNSIWAFVAANNTINPFDLVAPNSSMFATNNADKIDDKYFKISYYNSRDQDNKPIKLASIKSYLGLPGYITANINDDINKELGDFKYFNKNYKINIEEQMKNKLVSVGYNYIFDNN